MKNPHPTFSRKREKALIETCRLAYLPRSVFNSARPIVPTSAAVAHGRSLAKA
jgi:hypothetical protein